MALDFPANPTNGQTYLGYTYNSTTGAWLSNASSVAPVYMGDVPPTNPTNGNMWFNTTDGTLYLYYYDGTSYQWVEARAPITSDGYYSPNYIINGGFDIWQRGTSFTAAGYTADRWSTTIQPTGITFSVSQIASPNAKFSYAIRIQATSSGTATEFATRHFFERQHIAVLAGKSATLSFWYRSNRVGSHVARITTAARAVGGVNQNINFTVSTANTWEYKTITFSAFAGVTGWNFAAAEWGAHLDIGMMTDGGAGVTSIVTNDYFELTGVQLEEGLVATAFRRNAASLQGELAACQRYYYRISGGLYTGFGTGLSVNTTQAIITVPFHVSMRVAPGTPEFSNTIITDRTGYDLNVSGFGTQYSAVDSWTAYVNHAATATAGKPALFSVGNFSSGYLGFSAEL